ncbi:hypothetical protein CS022_23830 [Veronia nyctiphanis]|uniref:Uncharacterized protein n=1 Tax=Veronia nyctiphanis TaxID=1278244 RepID=A0A4Q0YI79_9GAMM|nr:hypothetical protein [Veronia nyctiphanis]RXJ69474.1 hypothetical protein CS022_23830 [Veronia nyctiphanis]
MNTFLTGAAFLPLLDEKVSAFLDSINAPSDINSAYISPCFVNQETLPIESFSSGEKAISGC